MSNCRYREIVVVWSLLPKTFGDTGEVPERSNGQSWKDCVRETVPRVRIPPSPHTTKCPEAIASGHFVVPRGVGFKIRSWYTRRSERVLVGELGSRVLRLL
jgi:hypothetical protein